MLSSLFLSFLLLFKTSLAACTDKFIHNASELIEFSNDVNSGTSYEGYTVYLVDDIIFDEQLSKQFEPIGKEENNYFLGTFDGQRYVISNLVVSLSSTNKIGIFGYSAGITIKNIIVDSSCSFSCSFQSTYTNSNMGGIIANLGAVKSQCIVENCVNMAKISYTGSSNNIFIGGITGQVGSTSSYGINIVNCVNYGTLYNSGSSLDNIRMGGIVPEIYEDSGINNNYLYNCLNYGTITNIGQANSGYYLGGIIAISWNSKIANCVSIGAISSNVEDRTGGFISALRNDQTTFSNCFWTSDTGRTQYSGESPTINGADISLISISSNVVSSLNTYATSNGLNEWVFNQNSKNIKFIVHDGKGFSYQKQLILLPRAERRGYSFLFWCVNQNSTNCIKKYVHSDSGFTAATTLYAQWIVNSCTVTLDVNGGDSLSASKSVISTKYDKKLTGLSTPTKRGYTFTGWFTVYGERLTSNSLVNNACNCTLTAHWNPNKYTVILDVNRGNKLENNTLTVTFDSTYGDLPTPTRDGFSFSGWFTRDNKQITKDTVVNVTSTKTLYAHWGPKTYTVTLDVNGGNSIPSNKLKVSVFADTAYYNLTTPTRRGYNFAGWYTEDNGLITNDTATTAIVSKDQTLYAHWTANNYTVDFDVNGGDEFIEEEDNNKTVTFDSIYDYLPTPTRTGYTFDGWVTRNNYLITNTTTVNIAYDHTLYAWWTANTYAMAFDLNGGDEFIEEEDNNKTVTFDSIYDYLPTPTRTGYSFLWWYIKGTREIVYNTTIVLTACNHVLCAEWIPNNYTVFLNVIDGNQLDKDEIKVTFDSTYGDLPVLTREGYSFVGWFTEDNENITSESIVRIASDHTLYARWTETLTNKVEIVFNSKDLSKEEVIDVIKQYTKDEFTIVHFEDASDEIKVIIEFNDVTSAVNFVENIRSTSDSITKSLVKSVKYSFSNTRSFSLLSYPFAPFIVFIL